MKLKDLKEKLNSLTDKELESRLIVTAMDKTVSGVGEIKKADTNYYDPECEGYLRTQEEVEEDDIEDCDELDVTIEKDQWYIEI